MSEDEKINRKELSQNAGQGLKKYSLNSIITYVLQIVSTLVLSKFLSGNDYGIFGTLRSWIASISYITDIGLSEGIVQQKEEITSQQTRIYLAIRITLALIMSILFSIFFYFKGSTLNIGEETNYFFYGLGLFAVLDILSAFPKFYFQKKLDFSSIAKIELISSVLLYIFQITLAVLGAGVWALFSGVLVKFCTFIYWGLQRKVFKTPSFKHLSSITPLIKKGGVFQLNLILIGLTGFISPIILNYYLPTNDVGLYFWANGLVSIPLAIIFNYQNILFPTFSKLQDAHSDLKILNTRSMQLLLILISCVFSLGAILSPTIVKIVFDQKWFFATKFISMLCLSVALYSIRQMPQTLLTGIGWANEKLIGELVYVVTLFTYTLINIKEMGLPGFIQALVVANALSLSVSLFLTRKYIYKEVYFRIIAFLLAAVASWYINYLNNPQLEPLKTIPSIGLLFFLSSVLDKDYLKDLLALLSKLKRR